LDEFVVPGCTPKLFFHWQDTENVSREPILGGVGGFGSKSVLYYWQIAEDVVSVFANAYADDFDEPVVLQHRM
jgi:hypothetical protein